MAQTTRPPTTGTMFSSSGPGLLMPRRRQRMGEEHSSTTMTMGACSRSGLGPQEASSASYCPGTMTGGMLNSTDGHVVVGSVWYVAQRTIYLPIVNIYGGILRGFASK